jgi:agmatine deiminase
MRILRFDPIPYPIWRRRMPGWLRTASRPLLRRWLPVDADERAPDTPEATTAYLRRWGLAGENSPPDEKWLTPKSVPDAEPRPAPDGPVRLPAQWEPVEAVILTWPVLYPALWDGHAQMVSALAPVAKVLISIPAPGWAGAISRFLSATMRLTPGIRFLHLPTDDIWVRDYGPIVGYGADGGRVCVKPVFDPLPSYPQARDNQMARRWAAFADIPVRALDLHLEGGNIWTDGAGTLIVSEQIFYSNPYLSRADVEAKLRAVFNFRKLIVTPRLKREETGHVDLVVKLADAQTVLVGARGVFYNGGQLRAAADLFRRESSAAGLPYRVLELPAPPPYLNWGVYPIWRSYTNALTVNGRVLVPVFGIPDDARALAIYREAMPGYEIVPINCRASVNGGGAVHCLTRDIPPAGSSGAVMYFATTAGR